MSQHQGKVAIITGGASGIGRALGDELCRRGAVVVLADRDGPGAERAADAMRSAGGRASAVTLDVTDADRFADVVDQVLAEHGVVDYLYNNAGIAIMGEASDHDLDDWNRTLDINLRGVIHGVHAVYPVMQRQGHGHIVNIASVAGLAPMVNEIAYVTAKHGVVGLSTTLRAEAAAYGVKVSVVCPGFIDTPILYENLDIKNSKVEFQSREETKKAVRFKVMPVTTAARKIVDGVARNRPIIVITGHAQLLWRAYRLWPTTVIAFMRFFMGDLRRRFPRK